VCAVPAGRKTCILLHHSAEVALVRKTISGSKDGIGDKGLENVKEFLRKGPSWLFKSTIHTRWLRHARAYFRFLRQKLWFEIQSNYFAPGGRVRTLVKYADDHVLQSGWIFGETRLQNKAAAVTASS
jgi:hypothetical protein